MDISVLLWSFYDDNVCKFKLAKSHLQNTEALERCGLKDTTSFLNITNDIIVEKQLLHYYHCHLLRLVYKSDNLNHVDNELVRCVANNIFRLSNTVLSSEKLHVQKEYLHLVYTCLKMFNSFKPLYKADLLLVWFQGNRQAILDKMLLKLLKLYVTGDDLNTLDADFGNTILVSLKKRGYGDFLLKPTKDFFIEQITTPTFENQAQALEIVLKLMLILFSKNTDLSPIFDDKLWKLSAAEINLIKSYIRTILVDDDDLFISNLSAITIMSTSLPSFLLSGYYKNAKKTALQLFCKYDWFCYFIWHLQFDQNVLIDWMMDKDSLCKGYLLIILQEIICNFECFISTFEEDWLKTNSITMDSVMSFLIRLNLGLEETHKNVSMLLDQIECLYDCLVNVTTDPLDGIISSKFSSQCSLDSGNDDLINTTLVPYSDSE